VYFWRTGISNHMTKTIDREHSNDSIGADTTTRILAAARKLFLAEGFSAISGDRLCKEARVSKTSLYKYYGDMAGVLAAVVQSEADLFKLGVETKPSSEADFWRTMFDYGVKVLTVLNNPFCIELVRILHEEARSKPELAEIFYENADKRCHGVVCSLISFGQSEGYINNTISASDRADQLISIWEGMNFVRARLGLTKLPFENPEEWSRTCIIALYPEASSVLQ